MSDSIVLGCAAVFVLLCFLVRRNGRFLYLTSKVPGPSLWEFVSVHVRELLSENFVSHIHKVSVAYNYRPWGMWSMSGFMVVVSDCDSFADVCKSKKVDSKMHMFYDQFDKYVGRGLLSFNGKEYKQHRRIIGPVFRKSTVESRLPEMNLQSQHFTQKLRLLANGEDVDTRAMVREQVAAMSLHYLADGHLPADEMARLMRATEEGLRDLAFESINPLYYPWNRLMTSARARADGMRWVKNVRDRVFDERKAQTLGSESCSLEGKKKLTCGLDVLLELHLIRGDDALAADKAAMAEIATILGASQDIPGTTSFTISTCLVLIALHPEVQSRICEEIDGIFGGSRLRRGPVEHEVEVLVEDLAQLKYLEMAIKEALRIVPPAPILGREADEDVVVGGVTVPKGSLVLLNILALHRNPEIYKDPLKYDPLRFLPELCKGRNSYAYLPFSAGTRNCPAELLAMTMVKTVMCHVFREFKVLPGTGTNSIDDIRPPMHFIFYSPKLPLRFVRRTN